MGPVIVRPLPLAPLSRTYGDRVLAVGDAAGLVKPTTGGGIYYSLLSAGWAADTVVAACEAGRFSSSVLSAYERTWREHLRIAEMARDLVRLSGLELGRDIEFVYTGLRPGEKLSEDLWSGSEDLEPTAQDKLLVIRRPEAEGASLGRLLAQMETLERLANAGDIEHLIQILRRMVPEY
jgi:flavin-dependent dehydrogenase